MNLVAALAILKNEIEYPLFMENLGENQDKKRIKLELSKQILSEIRKTNNLRLWVAIVRALG